MAQRSELGHRILELKTSIMGRLAPKILSRSTTGVDGVVKKLAMKGSSPESDAALASELEHPDDVPEIVTGHPTMPVDARPSNTNESRNQA